MMARHRLGRTVGWLTVGFLTWGVCGCSPSVSRVTGKVTVDGKPVQAGQVSFVAKTGMVYTANIEPDGMYQVDGVPVGEMTVLVFGPPPVPRQAAMDKKTATNNTLPATTGGPTVDPKYGDTATSGLNYTVNPGLNTYDIPLK
jgi:hypothetical protein